MFINSVARARAGQLRIRGGGGTLIKSTWLAALACLMLAGSTSVRATDGELADAYRLQPGDVLTVSTWKEADLQGEVVIRPDGDLSFPLAGEVRAAGQTVDQVRTEIESRLRRFVPEAVVSVLLKLPQGYRIYVIGKVNKPGDFMLNRPTDVMQALALAGGATPFADVDDIKILRRDAGRQTAISFHYSDVSRGKSLHQNVVLQGGDTVVVP